MSRGCGISNDDWTQQRPPPYRKFPLHPLTSSHRLVANATPEQHVVLLRMVRRRTHQPLEHRNIELLSFFYISNLQILRFEQNGEKDSHHKCITRKYQPTSAPITHQITIWSERTIMIDDLTCQ